MNYNLDFIQKIKEYFVPDKRLPKLLGTVNSFGLDISNIYDGFFSTYKNYSLVSLWVAGTYSRKDKVRYGKSIYQSVIDLNNSEPSSDGNWVLISENFFGNDYRLAIRGEKLILEKALNLWFETSFKQPPLVSDIFITTNTSLDLPVFQVGISETESSNVSTLESSQFVINNYSFGSFFNMSINVPLLVYNSLSLDISARDKIIRAFVDKYIPAGITYNIITY